ncbi:BrnA antitoxin family protein [Neorhizobium vignae]|uniref:BrnA antitoxin family protein n=1 Tax=Neorhizobium vignae TaxID=690585 RepID=UPI00056C0886|nr:BrnA antitoxin family protein [Neorhizobium vignae]
MKKSAEIVRYEVDRDSLPPLTEKQKAELEALSKLPDEQIDYSDIPGLTDEQLQNAGRGRFYRPLKQQITARVDADVVDWLKSQGKGYQARMNAILRREMLASLKSQKRS